MTLSFATNAHIEIGAMILISAIYVITAGTHGFYLTVLIAGIVLDAIT